MDNRSRSAKYIHTSRCSIKESCYNLYKKQTLFREMFLNYTQIYLGVLVCICSSGFSKTFPRGIEQASHVLIKVFYLAYGLVQNSKQIQFFEKERTKRKVKKRVKVNRKVSSSKSKRKASSGLLPLYIYIYKKVRDTRTLERLLEELQKRFQHILYKYIKLSVQHLTIFRFKFFLFYSRLILIVPHLLVQERISSSGDI